MLLADNRQADNLGIFYSDSSSPEVCTYEGDLEATEAPACTTAPPKPLEEAALEDEYLMTQAAGNTSTDSSAGSAATAVADPVIPTPQPAVVSRDQLKKSGPPSERSDVDAVAGGAVAAVVLLGLCAAGVALLLRRKARDETAAKQYMVVRVLALANSHIEQA